MNWQMRCFGKASLQKPSSIGSKRCGSIPIILRRITIWGLDLSRWETCGKQSSNMRKPSESIPITPRRGIDWRNCGTFRNQAGEE